MKSAALGFLPALVLAVLGLCVASAAETAPARGSYEQAVRDSGPVSYLRFEEDTPADGERAGAGTALEAGEPGPRAPALIGFSEDNKSLGLPGEGGVDAAGLRLPAPDSGSDYAVQFWFRNARPTAAAPVTGYLFGRDDANPPGYVGDNLGIGGSAAPTAAGRLFFFDGDLSVLFNGETDLLPNQWYHVTFCRAGDRVSVHLNGNLKPEIQVDRKAMFPEGDGGSITIGIRPDGFGAMLGEIDEVAIYDRPLKPEEIREHYLAGAGREWTPPGSEWRQRVRQELAQLPAPPPLPRIEGGTGEGDVNPIDVLLADWWSSRQIQEPALCEDREFLRRAYLDLVGLLPDERSVAEFLADASPAKRAALIDRLLADDLAYAEHWMTFWADSLRDDQSSYIAVTRHPITRWLFRALQENKPYDEFAAELLNPSDPEAAGFVKGIDWTFSSSVSDVPPMQVAQVTAQVFQGVNLKCASCHSHFTKDWTLNQSWAFASFFSPEDLQPYRCDKPRGKPSPPKFLFDGLSENESLPEGADIAARRAAVSLLITRPKNPRFAKTIVNRMFKRLIGQGLIDATDDLDDRTPFLPELLDRLAYDFMAHDYDLKWLLRTIANSRVYQMRPLDGPRPEEHAEEEPPFAGPRLRRMTAEQFLDGICCLTGYWPQVPAVDVQVPNPNVRAWRHLRPNKLAVVLGRPNREIVSSERPDRASTLAALEMVNGEILNGYLSAGAEHLLASDLGREPDPRKVIDTLCLRAYARPATESEVDAATELIGSIDVPAPERKAGWEDLLWLIVMNPDFQYLN